MNKSYKHVWSKKQGRYVVASEISKSHSGGYSAVSRAVLIALGLLSATTYAQTVANNALPTNPSIASGAATITETVNKLTINQSTDKLITNWSSFNIGKDATVQFIQPSSTASALNRINSSDPSYIYGTLQANGQVLFINQSGVLFAPGARVDAASVVTSTLNILNSNYLNNNFVFEKNVSAGSISNQGSLNALIGGTVALIAPQISNTGTIRADGGNAALLSADKVTLSFAGNRLIKYSLDQGTLNSLIENSGSIRANDGVAILSAKAVDSLNKSLVNNSGVIEAKGITQDGGKIILDADNGTSRNSGELNVSSDIYKAGEVSVTADFVQVMSGARILAQGLTAGGRINIGGGFAGQELAIRNAKETDVYHGSLIDASALGNGSGGQVVIWSDLRSSFSGLIYSKAGALGGDGGFVEVSSKVALSFSGSVDTTSLRGNVGSLLIDPYSIFITNTGSDANNTYSDGVYSTISQTVLSNNLATSNVILDGTRDIVFGTDFSYSGSADRTLTLTTPLVVLGGNISSTTNKLNLNFGNANIYVLGANRTVNTNNGNISVNGNIGSSATGYGLTFNAGTGTVNLGSNGSSVVNGSFTGTYWTGTTSTTSVTTTTTLTNLFSYPQAANQTTVLNFAGQVLTVGTK
ncbi:filamentous hemagglutinin N-terminal domain-containing protein [Polynucleobacter sp. MWH-Loch1C5]|uniref:two-partner secretion domain-containing protein n=1 Tax=Polynucleobacter sp. MWH-Loch1C5 TaxID=2689108 RepID=UPI001C0D87EA|nr:filamentous hemagglutinin N-terminal domain-containing protein [Polynucleobacter sp. MWH-Loch1C5]MBU3543276.1 filamentous hemagglutinin N-terminal domain-containing protein [Polynucleobacter sp. MWH-Loch1C5]